LAVIANAWICPPQAADDLIEALDYLGERNSQAAAQRG